jgi:hypothetical protein
MTTAADVAQWMVEELKRVKYLYQEEAVHQIAQRFGDKFTYINNEGGYSIGRDVLAAFRRLTEPDVVWERGDRMWRLREKYDEPGRRQD